MARRTSKQVVQDARKSFAKAMRDYDKGKITERKMNSITNRSAKILYDHLSAKDKLKVESMKPSEMTGKQWYTRSLTESASAAANRQETFTARDVGRLQQTSKVGMTSEERAVHFGIEQFAFEQGESYKSIQKVFRDSGMPYNREYIKQNTEYIKKIDPITGKSSWSFRIRLPNGNFFTYSPGGIRYRKGKERGWKKTILK